MRRYLTEQEVKTALKTLTVIVDTNEKVNQHILEYLTSKKIPYIKRALNVGDYSFELDGMTYEDIISIERKANIEEIARNFTVGRTRFKNEFTRALASGTKMFLMIENCSWQDIKSHNYTSKLNPESLLGSLMSWQAKYNITVNFVKQEQAGELIAKTLFYWARSILKP